VNASDWPSSRPASRTQKWCGDITEISTDEGKHYLATVLDLFSRKLLTCPTSTHPDAELACDAIKIATTVLGGRATVNGVVFHTDRGSTYTARHFIGLCKRLGAAGTAPPDCGHPTTTRRPPQKSWPRHDSTDLNNCVSWGCLTA